ncbi:MAG: Hydantoinase/oxoprolinase [ANME-2 cluster archaeon HR1]|nr:MAG: Hydantoinase/oxoprolinase [ANME-2 cluster archaeon HR1]
MNFKKTVIGIDIGGANTKVASIDKSIAQLHYIPLWKDTGLPEALQDIASKLNPDKVAIVMTGELADCFSNKEEGIRFIMKSVDAAFPDALYLNNNGQFIDNNGDIKSLAAANWMASALIAGKDKDCIFADVGSTTTDLIPVKDGYPLAGKTDFQRLGRHELIYSGILRTNIATILDRIDLYGTRYRVSSEFFAQTADVYLLLERIMSEDYTCDTADNEAKNKEDAARRLARVVCADTSEIDYVTITEIAQKVYKHQRNELSKALKFLSLKHGIDHIVGAGLGEFLVQDAAQHTGLTCTIISEIYGTDISKVFPAYAVACLADEI